MNFKDRPVGYTWLIKQYDLSTLPLSHESYIGMRARSDASTPGVVQQVFPPAYWPGDGAFEHIVFALKYDELSLDVLRQVFAKLGSGQVLQYIEGQPNGKYARQLAYLYEFLTGELLDISVAIGGAYVDLLDPDKYLVSARPHKSVRWHINDNLLGTARFCPLVRKTFAIQPLLTTDFNSRLEAFRKQVDPALFQRAIDYLYFKETKSSYDIERETPTPDRAERFVAVLRTAGTDTLADVLSEASLTRLQNLIVEPRYEQKGFRDWQNYVGESPPGRSPIVHYICPPGDMVRDLMEGLLECARKTEGLHPVVRAALVSFGFVFIHPFEDGNGRIHRYLIHDFLGRDGIVPAGMILPVSATMLRHPHEYDRVLEAFSRALRPLVRYTLDGDERLAITNPAQAAGWYRYPDLTIQASYLLNALEQTISAELVSEILFIRNYDRARDAIRDVVDIPNRRLDRLIKLLHQNNGVLSANKRGLYQEIGDDELQKIQAAFQEAFTE